MRGWRWRRWRWRRWQWGDGSSRCVWVGARSPAAKIAASTTRLPAARLQLQRLHTGVATTDVSLWRDLRRPIATRGLRNTHLAFIESIASVHENALKCCTGSGTYSREVLCVMLTRELRDCKKGDMGPGGEGWGPAFLYVYLFVSLHKNLHPDPVRGNRGRHLRTPPTQPGGSAAGAGLRRTRAASRAGIGARQQPLWVTHAHQAGRRRLRSAARGD